MQPGRRKRFRVILVLLLAVIGATAGYHRYSTDSFVGAAESLSQEKMERFLFFGMDPNARDSQGRTALTVLAGASTDQPQLVNLLLESGADPDAADAKGWTPLMTAAIAGRAGDVEALVRCQGDLAKLSGSSVPVDPGPRLGVMEALIKGGATVDKATPEGLTALAMAIFAGRPEAVDLLMASGANPNHRDSFEHSAWQYNVNRDRMREIARLFTKHGYNN
ncbi:MAG: ankyrin repeat domain-containing protein [Desulfovibrionaceae bacterium]|nr:ankyrin repeat domain-containing protein [Desulfovibrionaceae bacterium]